MHIVEDLKTLALQHTPSLKCHCSSELTRLALLFADLMISIAYPE